MKPELENLNIYVKVKWMAIAAAGALITIEGLLGIAGPAAVFVAFGVLGVSALGNLWLSSRIKRAKAYAWCAHCVMYFDLLLVVLALYFTGGIENTWLFFPAILIFFSGYIFSFGSSLAFAGISCILVLGMFLLEYFKAVPHISLYGMPELYLRSPEYGTDYFTGMFILYFFAAFASGYLNRTMHRYSEKLEKTVKALTVEHEESEKRRRLLLGIMADLGQTKTQMEARIKERTAELESKKTELEKKVFERTRDVEDNRRAVLHMLKDLKEDVAKLKEVDRMKNEFISVVSHELRTPLTPLMDYTNIVIEGIAGPITEKQKNILDSILRLSKRELNLINSLLDISRLESGIFSPVKKPLQLLNIISDSLADVEKEAGKKRITINKEVIGEPPAFMADEGLIVRLVAQLINNALKFTPEGGEIKARCSYDGEKIRCEVKDTGIGLERGHLEKIFEKFYQVDTTYSRQFGGLGLGLAICKQIIAAHNGEIWAESDGLGKGTSLIFTIPICPRTVGNLH